MKFVSFLIIAVIFLSGCTAPVSEETNETHSNETEPEQELNAVEATPKIPEQQLDPALARNAERLKEYGIDCTFENTHATRNSLAVDPSNPDTLYVGIEGKGMYKSMDKGTTWKKIVNGLMAYPDSNDKGELCFPDIAETYIDPVNTQRLLMTTSDISTAYIDWPYGETGGIWESLDGGYSWKQIIKSKINVAGSGSLAIDPKNPEIIYYPVNPDAPTFKESPIKESLNKKGSVYKTTDGGETWKELEMPMLSGLQAMVIGIDPKDSNHIIFLTQSHDHIYGENSITEVYSHEQRGILESFDGGNTWDSFLNLPDPYTALFDGDISENNFNHIIVRPFLFGPEFPGETTQQKSFYSVDTGKTFKQTSMFIWVGRYDPHDKEGNHLLGYSPWEGWIVESRDAGATWQSIGIPPEVASYSVKIDNFVWDPKDPDTVYMSAARGNVWRSTNGGKTWSNILNLDKLPKY